jgi:S-adenosylmethionine hydrolase
MSIITLTTDFGVADWFVGAMKGVVLTIHPRAFVVDVTHEIPAGDIRAGAFALAACYGSFPKRTVHVAVVDPGVGSKRKAIAVQTAKYQFVGPDNGVLSLSLANEKIKTIRALENEDYFLRPVSRTFHGRDIFAPVAGHLSRGLPIQKLGPALKDFVRLKWPRPRQSRGSIEGEVVYLDRFGNGITNISGKLLSGLSQASCYIFAPRRCVCPLKDFYQGVPAGKPVAVPGSSGFVEIALNSGSAAERLGLKIGTPVVLRHTRAARGRVKE